MSSPTLRLSCAATLERDEWRYEKVAQSRAQVRAAQRRQLQAVVSRGGTGVSSYLLEAACR